jgi:hypothetical protein
LNSSERVSMREVNAGMVCGSSCGGDRELNVDARPDRRRADPRRRFAL